VYRELQSEGAELLAGEGIDAGDHYFARSADMRYVGQEYTVSVAVGQVDLHEIDRAFHDAHRIRYGHATPGAPVEFVNLRLAAFGRIAGRAAPFRPPAEANGAARSRPAVFDGEAYDAAVLLRDGLRPGEQHEGPVVVEEESATTVVPPGHAVRVDEHGNLLIKETSRWQ
jgi:N-methylhydantoinase A